MKVYVIDEMMGSGKTSAMINHVNSSPDNKRFLFITPYCAEDVRIQHACPDKHFYIPLDDEGTKLMDIKRLMREGKNIASTHALFSHFDQEAIDLVASRGYSLVIDEEMCLIDKPEITQYDLKMMFAHHIEVDEDSSVRWITPDYTGRLNPEKREIEKGFYKCYAGTTILKVLPTDIFTAFEEVFVMTYLFEHSYHAAYFTINNIEWTRMYVTGDSLDTYRLTLEPQPAKKMDLRLLVHICDNDKMNAIGDPKNKREKPLTKGWYSRNILLKEGKNGTKTSDSAMAKQLSRNTYNFFRWYAGVKSKNNLWTTFTEYKNAIKGPGFSSAVSPKGCFLACNARASNEHRNRTALAYLVNRYMDTNIKNWLIQKGVHISDDGFALSEMVQWIWRSAIRDGKEIWIYIPSRRMRTLLIDWMDSLAEGGDTDATM